MKLHILHEAEEELSETIQYYDDNTPGLGIRLKNQANKAFIGLRPTVSCHASEQKDSEGSIANPFPIISPTFSAMMKYSL